MDAAAIADGFANGPRPERAEGTEATEGQGDQPLQGLVLLAQFHGIAADAAQLRHDAGRGTEPFDETALLLAARKLKLKAKVVRHPADRIDRVALPALALQQDGKAFVVAKVDNEKVLIQDLDLQRPQVLTREEFSENMTVAC